VSDMEALADGDHQRCETQMQILRFA
jgi:hypothetical protein